VRLLLRAKRRQRSAHRIEVERLLDDGLTGLQERALALELGLDPALEEAETVHVLELGLGAERLAARRAQRDIRVAAQASLLHVHVGDAELAQGVAQELCPRTGLGGASDVGLGHDLDQRRSAPVEVDQRSAGAVDPARSPDVDELRGVLLEVHAMDANLTQPPRRRERDVVLADLVALRQVRVEVVLAVEDGAGRHLAFERGGNLQRIADRLLVWNRQDPGVSQADRAGVHVRLIPEGELATAEHLRPRPELNVDLEADHGFEARVARGPLLGLVRHS
jgi:hypothetical protein